MKLNKVGLEETARRSLMESIRRTTETLKGDEIANVRHVSTCEDENDEIIEEKNKSTNINNTLLANTSDLTESINGDKDIGGIGDIQEFFQITDHGTIKTVEGEPPETPNKVEINGKVFVHNGDEQVLKELETVAKIAQKETGPLQLDKILMVVFMVTCILTVNLLTASDALVDIKKCSGTYWGLIGGLLILCITITFLAIYINKAEQALKIKYGINYRPEDPLYEGSNLRTLIVIGFFGGFIAGALGLGGGSIYNPAFLEMGIHPKTSSATGMFLVLISTINSVTINYLNGYLDIEYGLWVSSFALLGSILGMMGTDYVVRKTGKPSILVWLLTFVFVVSTITTPIFGGI